MSASPPPVLDETDRAIVALLQDDGRRSYGELGKAVGLSEAAARQRVNRLRESGIIHIVAIADPIKLGRTVVATIGVRVSGDTRRVAARLAELPQIEYVVITAGSFDLVLEVVCLTEDELLETINDGIRTIEGVRETETFIHLRMQKDVYAWGKRAFAPGEGER